MYSANCIDNALVIVSYMSLMVIVLMYNCYNFIEFMLGLAQDRLYQISEACETPCCLFLDLWIHSYFKSQLNVYIE